MHVHVVGLERSSRAQMEVSNAVHRRSICGRTEEWERNKHFVNAHFASDVAAFCALRFDFFSPSFFDAL